MSTDVFRRVGRGGAGNFYSKKDIQDAENASTEVQAVPPNPRTIPPSPVVCITNPPPRPSQPHDNTPGPTP
jgi:hypothetical protein